MNMKEPVTEPGRGTLKSERDPRIPTPFQIRLRPLCRQEVDETTKFFVFFILVEKLKLIYTIRIALNILYFHWPK